MSEMGPGCVKTHDAELARRKFVSITLNKKRTALAVTVERRKERKQFCAFSARARFHTRIPLLVHVFTQPWTQFGHLPETKPSGLCPERFAVLCICANKISGN